MAEDVSAEATKRPLHFFYLPNTLLGIGGFALLALPLLPYLITRRRHLFIVIGALTMIAVFVANIFIQIPLGWRFSLLAVFFLQIALVWILLELTPTGPRLTGWASNPRLRVGAALSVALLLAYLTISNVSVALARFEKADSEEESSILRYARQIGEIAGVQGVVFGPPENSWPIPTFGPRVVTLEHPNPFVTDTNKRLRDVERFYHPKTTDQQRSSILARYDTTHVLIDDSWGVEAAERFLKKRGKVYELQNIWEIYQFPQRSRIYALGKNGFFE
jgi:hypothetical protein